MHSCTDNEYLRGQLRQDASDCAAYRRADGRTGCEGCERDGADGRWGERVCEDTELGGVRACAGMVHKVSTYPSGDRRSGSKALHGTEHVERDLIYKRGNISLSDTNWIS